MRRLTDCAALLCAVTASACTGLVAGPEVSAVTPVPASRDSAYVRARRAVQSEAFTLDVVDSLGGHLVGTRFPSSNAQLGSASACRVTLDLQVRGDGGNAEVAAISRWVAPGRMMDKAPQVCEGERLDVLERITQTIVPPAVAQ
ncbi:MAG: hypothetical protein ACREMX_01485 [Gemmatimonadales bacterium]